jgi:hypothetical protein
MKRNDGDFSQMTELTCSKQLSGSGSEKIDHMKEAFLPE